MRHPTEMPTLAPGDSAKPDEEAIDDVYTQVDATGSIEAAARKLQLFAKLQQQQQQSPSPTEAGPSGLSASARQRQMAMWEDDPEEQAYIQNKHPSSMDVDEDEQEDEGGEVVHLQEVVEGLWIGDLVGAMDTDGLEERGISNILSLLRPSLTYDPEFAHFAVEIDDSPETDILTHLPACVAWIHEALTRRTASKDSAIGSQSRPQLNRTVSARRVIPPNVAETKPGSVLVHCQAGVSRSATVVAAYLMRAMDVDPVEAVEIIRRVRPQVDPSEAFWHQLGLFYNADLRVSLRDKSTRRFYMERTTADFMNGDGGAPAMDKMAKYPATPTPSHPATPLGGAGRRKIRCKMCRRHLAVREHMMDHILDQAPISRPRTPSNFALPSPKFVQSQSGMASAQDAVSTVINPLTGQPGATTSRRSSMTGLSALAMTASPAEKDEDDAMTEKTPKTPKIPLPKSSGPVTQQSAPTSGLAISSLSGDAPMNGHAAPSAKTFPVGGRRASEGRGLQSAGQLNSRLPPALLALRTHGLPVESAISTSPTSSPEKEDREKPLLPAAPQINAVNAATRTRRLSSALAMTPTASSQGFPHRRSSSSLPDSPNTSQVNIPSSVAPPPPPAPLPILVNPKCSGYFVEPLTWMEPFLRNGQIAGKITCPNEKCNAKIGNFDWAGVQCGCKEWVTPGFCIHRSKVDEVW